jgi:glycosyltransferase involved in cell wall biosynthesis
MDWRSQCAAIIPCLNEEATIAPLTAGVRTFLPVTLVVDDGSSDRTAVLARSAGAEVLSHKMNLGKGAALHTGWRAALDRGFRWALSLDGDGQHAPADIPDFLRCADQTGAALVVGDRLTTIGPMPLTRRIVNRWMSRRLSRLAGQRLPDSQCGFRLMDLQAWSTLPIHTQHFEIESEVLMAFIMAGRQVEFIPIQIIYKGEQSKISPLRDAIRWMRWLKTIRMKSRMAIKPKCAETGEEPGVKPAARVTQPSETSLRRPAGSIQPG